AEEFGHKPSEADAPDNAVALANVGSLDGRAGERTPLAPGGGCRQLVNLRLHLAGAEAVDVPFDGDDEQAAVGREQVRGLPQGRPSPGHGWSGGVPLTPTPLPRGERGRGEGQRQLNRAHLLACRGVEPGAGLDDCLHAAQLDRTGLLDLPLVAIYL